MLTFIYLILLQYYYCFAVCSSDTNCIVIAIFITHHKYRAAYSPHRGNHKPTPVGHMGEPKVLKGPFGV